MSYYTNLDNMNNVDELSDAVELIRELRDEVRSLEKRVNLLELAAMKDEDIDFSDIPATTDEELSRFTRMNKDLWDKGAYG